MGKMKLSMMWSVGDILMPRMVTFTKLGVSKPIIRIVYRKKHFGVKIPF